MLVAKFVTSLPLLCILGCGQLLAQPPRVGWVTGSFISQEKLNELKIVSYYPSEHGWANMWLDWHPETIDRDFERMAHVNANTVRLFVFVKAFGYPRPSATMLSRLHEAVELAARHRLMVQITLFDWLSNFNDIPGSETWADEVVSSFRDDPSVAFLELKNEIQPEDPVQMKWARDLLPYVKRRAGDIPVTISVTSGPAGGPNVELQRLITELGSAQPDFYDLHPYYGAPKELYYQLNEAKRIASERGMALLAGEIGASTNPSAFTKLSVPQTQTSYDEYQDFVFRSAFYATSALGLPAPGVWIWSDFAPGSLTWLPPTSSQYDFGIYRADGTAKRSARTVAEFFSTGHVHTSFNNGFENWIPGTPDLPALWQISGANLGHFASDTAKAHSGKASVKIWDSSSSSNTKPSFFITPISATKPNARYGASVYVMGENATGTTQICLSWFTSDFKYIGNSCGGSLAGTTPWQQISVETTAPQTAAYVELFLTSADNSGTAWFDDVRFQ